MCIIYTIVFVLLCNVINTNKFTRVYDMLFILFLQYAQKETFKSENGIYVAYS